MKMRLMTFDEAYETCSRKYPTKIGLSKEYVFGIGKDALPWGKKVEVDINTLSNGYIPAYAFNGFFVPACVFKADDVNTNDVLRYGTILTDDGLYDHYYSMDKYVRIRIIAYNGIIYYHKMVNGEIVEFKKVGVVE